MMIKLKENYYIKRILLMMMGLLFAFQVDAQQTTKQGYLLVDGTNAVDTRSASNGMIRRGIVLEWHEAMSHQSKSLMYWILGIGLALLFVTFGDKENQSSSHYYTMLVLFIALSILELYHLIGYDGDITWFYSPSAVGWGWTIVNFILTVAVFLGQVVSFILCANFLLYSGGRDCSVLPGLVCLIISIVAFFICGLFRIEKGFVYSLWFFPISQVCVFIYWLYCNARDRGSWANMAAVIAFYIFGVVSLLFVLAAIIPTLLAVIISLFFLNGFGNSSSADAQIKTLDNGVKVKRSHSNIWVDVTDSNNQYERDWTTGHFTRI